MGCVGRRGVWVWGGQNLKKIQTGRQAGKVAKTRTRSKRGKNVELSKRDIELMRDMFEFDFWSIEALAKKFGCPVAQARGLVTYKTDSKR